MALIRRTEEHKPQQKSEPVKQFKKPVPVDWKRYELDPAAQLPYGKFIGRTVEYIQANEEWYWSWLMDNNLLGSWGLVREREQQKPRAMGTEVGDMWMCLVVYDRPSIPAPTEWYQDNQ